MKNILLACLSIILFLPKFSNAQKKGDAGVIAAAGTVAGAIGVIAAASSVELAKEAMERNMVEWVLSKKDHSKKTTFDLSLMKWEASKKEDLSKVSVVGFKYTEKTEGHQVLLNICSPGWWNDYGVDFSRVTVYEINKNNWTKILLAYLNLSKEAEEKEITDIEKIPVVRNKEKITLPIYQILSISNRGFIFELGDSEKTEYKFNFNEYLKNGDTHTVVDIGQEYKIDFNEGNMNIFLKATGDLIRLKRDFIVDITKKVFADKIITTSY